MSFKTSLLKAMTVTLGMLAVASTANAHCILVDERGEFVNLVRGACFFGGTEAQYHATNGQNGCAGATEVFLAPEYNDAFVAVAMTVPGTGWSAYADHNSTNPLGGGGQVLRGGEPQVLSFQLTGDLYKTISAFRCG